MDPIVNGDPEAMRSLAARLRSHAELIAAGSDRVRARAGTLDYEGPAAERFRAGTIERHRRAVGAAGRLQDFANHVLRRANEVEDALVVSLPEEDPGCL